MMLKQVVQLLHPSSLGGARRCLGGDGIRNPYLDIRQRLRLRSIATSQMGSNEYKFGPYKIHEKEVFYSTDLSYAMVNLRPLVPGTHPHLILLLALLVISYFLISVLSSRMTPSSATLFTQFSLQLA
ncbi:hypothetical protein Droror1_Dr00003340 [Drosera rotundifolia]